MQSLLWPHTHNRGVVTGTEQSRLRTHRTARKYHHLIVALAVRDSVGILLVEVKAMLNQELH